MKKVLQPLGQVIQKLGNSFAPVMFINMFYEAQYFLRYSRLKRHLQEPVQNVID